MLLGLFLRLYRFDTYPLGFDQIQILENSQAISEGHPRLIGPMTGPAQFYTGPLIYYLASFWQIILRSPYLLVATSVSIYLLSGVILYKLINKYLTSEYQLIYFILWAISPFVIKFDRVTWNPNLTLVAALMVFFPMFRFVQKKKINILDAIVLWLGIFLGYQAHFSGLILPLLVFLIWILMIRRQLLRLLFCLSGLLFSLIPTIVFDLRHSFLNFNGVMSFLTANQKSGEITYLRMFWKNILITMENIGKVFFEQNSYVLVIITGIVCLILYLWKENRDRKQAFVILWLLISVILISIYKKTSPEYYFIIQIPAILYFLSILLRKTLSEKNKILLVGFVFFVYSFFIVQKTVNSANALSFDNQMAAVKYLKQEINYGVSYFEYDMKPVDQIALQYLLRNYVLKKEGALVHLVYPHTQHGLSDKTYGPLAIWKDPRRVGLNYLELKTMILGMPPRVSLHQNYQDEKKYLVNSLFSVLVDNQKLGNLIILDRRINELDYDRFDRQLQNCDVNHNCQNTNKHWMGVVNSNSVLQIRREADVILVFDADKQLNSDQMEQIYQIAVVKK